jgi:hypothetical protein
MLPHRDAEEGTEGEERRALNRTVLSLIGGALWLFAGWDGHVLYSDELPRWALVPIVFYILAGLILLTYGSERHQ